MVFRAEELDNLGILDDDAAFRLNALSHGFPELPRAILWIPERVDEGRLLLAVLLEDVGKSLTDRDAFDALAAPTCINLTGIAPPDLVGVITEEEFIEFPPEAVNEEILEGLLFLGMSAGYKVTGEDGKENRYLRLMNKVVRAGVKTKVLMLSATPVNNRFTDLRNQLALAYEGYSAQLSDKLRSSRSIEEIFRQAQAAFNVWSRLPPEQRTSQAILETLDYDFFELLDSVTIARSRKHIQTFYDTRDIGSFPERLKPLSYRCPLTHRAGIPDFNAIFTELSLLKLAVYAPLNYLLPSRLARYEAMYDTRLGGKKVLRQADRERSLQALMTTNLLKRLESSVEALRLTLGALLQNCEQALKRVQAFRESGNAGFAVDVHADAW